jgi:hypothetical protein
MTEKRSLEEILMQEMSRRNTDAVVDLIVQQPILYDEIFRIFLRIEEPVSRRAAWVVDIYSENHPECLSPYREQLIDKLNEFNHDGLKRHSLRMLARLPLPDDEHMGTLMNVCFNWLIARNESVAVKIYCMEILYMISQLEPDLKKELADSIEWRINEETPGFKNKGEKLLKKLRREIEKYRIN